MAVKRKKSSIAAVLLVLFILMAAGAGVLASIARYLRSEDEKAAIAAELARTEMELSIRRAAADQAAKKAAAEEAAKQAAADETASRPALTRQMLRRNAEELLTLVNPWNEVPEDWEPRLVDIGDGMRIDERAAGALDAMLTECSRSWSRFPCPISAYRTQDYQQGLYEDKIRRVIEEGYSEDEAPAIAAQSVAVPGTSEHQLGFSVDIIDADYPELDLTQEWTYTQRWLIANCSNYGFILRYPNGSSDITGIIYEPWHYRYVGVSTAKEIESLGVTFEEYVEMKSAEVQQ